MDRLQIVKAVFHHSFKVPSKRSNKVQAMRGKPHVVGYGVGYMDWENIAAKKKYYGIVILVDPAIPEEDLKKLPKSITVNKKDVKKLANKKDVSKHIKVQIKYKKERVFPVDRTRSLRARHAPAFALAGGDPVFSDAGWIGTGGYVFTMDGAEYLASNNHVFSTVGQGGNIINNSGVKIAEVTHLNPASDSALARLDNGVNFSKEIPGIGLPSQITGGIDVGRQCKKRGAATGVTEFQIIWKGIVNGIEMVAGTNGPGNAVVGNGDSGSIVIDNNKNDIIGLVTSGSIVIGSGPGGDLYQNIWAVDIALAFPNISL